MPALLVSSQARWTLNAFAGGFCRAVLKGGVLGDLPEEGTYRLLMEGLEHFTSLLSTDATDDEESGRVNATTALGQRYFSARPQARGDR